MKPVATSQKGIFYGCTAAISFAIYTSMNRYVYLRYHAAPFYYAATFMICSGGFAGLSLLFNYYMRKAVINKKQLLPMILNGLIGSLAIGLLVFGQRYTIAVNTSIIAASSTISTILFSRLLVKESLNRSQVAWLVVMFVSVYFAIAGTHLLSLNKGDLIILAGAAVLGLSNTYPKVLMKHSSSEVIADTRLITSGLLFAVLGFLASRHDFLITSAGLWPVVSGFFFWLTVKSFYESVKLIGPSQAIVLGNGHPVITPFIGVLLLNEPYTWTKAIGSALLLISIYKITKRH